MIKISYPDYQSKIKRLHLLIDKRGDYSSNLTPSENYEYMVLIEWYQGNH